MILAAITKDEWQLSSVESTRWRLESAMQWMQSSERTFESEFSDLFSLSLTFLPVAQCTLLHTNDQSLLCHWECAKWEHPLYRFFFAYSFVFFHTLQTNLTYGMCLAFNIQITYVLFVNAVRAGQGGYWKIASSVTTTFTTTHYVWGLQLDIQITLLYIMISKCPYWRAYNAMPRYLNYLCRPNLPLELPPAPPPLRCPPNDFCHRQPHWWSCLAHML